MNKKDLAELIADRIGSSKADGERAVNTVFDTIHNELMSGNEVSVGGFGIFSAKIRAARTARNPRTGEKIQIPEIRVPKFRAALALKKAVRG